MLVLVILALQAIERWTVIATILQELKDTGPVGAFLSGLLRSPLLPLAIALAAIWLTYEGKRENHTEGGNSIATGGNARIGDINVYASAPPAPTLPQEEGPVPTLEFAGDEWVLLDETNPLLPSFRPEDIRSHVLIAKFRNPRRGVGQTTPTAYGVHAQLTFRSSAKKEIGIHHGHWLGRYEHFIDFGPGETRILAVLLSKGNTLSYTLENHNSFDPRKRRIRSGITVLHGPTTVLLSEFNEVEIALISKQATLYASTFGLDVGSDGTTRLREVPKKT